MDTEQIIQEFIRRIRQYREIIGKPSTPLIVKNILKSRMDQLTEMGYWIDIEFNWLDRHIND